MVKIPGTIEAVPVIREMIAEGKNINITLLFSIDAYERVANAYIDALEQRVKEGKPIDRIASVASFFVSRVDTLVDSLLNEKISEVEDPRDRKAIEELRGKAPSPTPSSPMPSSKSSSAVRAGTPSKPKAPARSVRSGPAPAPRTRTTRTPSTSTP